MGEVSVSVDNLSVCYGKTPVLLGVSFVVPTGNLVGIIGPNGAGKTTLLKTLLGLISPISGTIRFCGNPFKTIRNSIAYIPQRSSVDWDFPIHVLDVVLMGCYGKLGLLKRPKKEDKKLAMASLERVGMASFANRQIGELSGGQQQRVFFARALLQEADYYFMDEPFSGVDMATEKILLDLLVSLKQEGKTLFVVHHDLITVKSYFDWAILLNNSLVACGPIEEIYTIENLKTSYGANALFISDINKPLEV